MTEGEAAAIAEHEAEWDALDRFLRHESECYAQPLQEWADMVQRLRAENRALRIADVNRADSQTVGRYGPTAQADSTNQPCTTDSGHVSGENGATR